ncbi:unnamed protein product [Rhizophagus irregularis]|uniref:Uncharacterized protein n=1 Tax=Rhizophagus irregularis TaxID=588596 RepID=A0A915YNK3_9GLOM|nr:unnamed protein product [Rhizophagus irregularis]CAB5298146.1 unnamed protein product [Rhizophagus irregularis]
MEENVENYFIVFLLGLGSMIAFHNLIISIRKYFTRNYGKVSDMLRIICNYGNLWRFLLSLGYFMTPSDVTPGPCKALGSLVGYCVSLNTNFTCCSGIGTRYTSNELETDQP